MKNIFCSKNKKKPFCFSKLGKGNLTRTLRSSKSWEKNLKKSSITFFQQIRKFSKKMFFLADFLLLLLLMVLCTESGFFALYLVHQNTSFQLSKSTFQLLFWFFTLKGDPYGFGVVKSYPEWKTYFQKFKKKYTERFDQVKQENGW